MYQQSTIHGIAFGGAAGVTTAIGVIINFVNSNYILLSLPSFLAWFLIYFLLKNKNIAEMHGIERKTLLSIGTRIAIEKITTKAGLPIGVSENDPTESPFIKEARECVDIFMRS